MTETETLHLVGNTALWGKNYEDIKRLQKRLAKQSDVEALAWAVIHIVSQDEDRHTLKRRLDETPAECEMAP